MEKEVHPSTKNHCVFLPTESRVMPSIIPSLPPPFLRDVATSLKPKHPKTEVSVPILQMGKSRLGPKG